MSRKRFQFVRLAVPAAALAVVIAMGLEQMTYATAKEAQPYHDAVAQAVNAIPMRIDVWVGQEVPVPPSALRLLQPNAICSRQYVDERTGRAVSLLVVHCRDARDMAGHYPPICYPSHGWTQRQSRRFSLEGTPGGWASEYEFSMTLPTQSRLMTVMNVLVMPDGRLEGDISAIRDAASDYRTHFYGAGQIQLVFAQDVPATEREEIFEEFREALGPVLMAIGSGGTK